MVINNEKDQKVLENLSYNLILNLASVCNAETSNSLEFFENYYGKLNRKDFPFVEKLLEYGVIFYKTFVLPEKI